MTADDYVDVKLSEAGERLAAGDPAAEFAGERGMPCVRVTGGDYDYCFEPGKAQRLPGREFRARLESAAHQGQRLFEVVEPAGERS